MSTRIGAWFKERWPVAAVMRWALKEEIPGGASWAYILGSSALFLFLVEVLTGVWQLLYYVATTDHAYNSVTFLRLHVSFGWLIHGLHYWGANAFVVVLALHVGRVFIWGAYKRPRELTWLTGALLFLTLLVLMFTGSLLPWDELGYWAAQVGTNMAGTVPWIGGFLEALSRGGDTMGQLTLSRFFTFHVAVLPAIMAFLIAVHLVAFRQFGSVGPWLAEKRAKAGEFWPDQVLKDAVAVSVLFVILVVLCAYWRAPIYGPADPLDNTYQPKPDWVFLFLYQALKAFPGPWEPVGTLAIPLVLIILVLLVPFVDRREERNPARRPVMMTAAFIFATAVIVLSIGGYLSRPEQVSAIQSAAAGKASVPAQPADRAGQPDTETTSQQKGAGQGKELFTTLGCLACHSVGGVGGTTGPNLSDEGDRNRSREWLLTQLEDPKAHNANSAMPPVTSQTKEHLDDLVDYLLGLKNPVAAATAAATAGQGAAAQAAKTTPGPAADMVGNVEIGTILFREYCQSCHGERGKDNVVNAGSDDGTVPALNPIDPALKSADARDFARKIDLVVQHGSTPAGPHPAIEMPAFGDSGALTQEQISAIEAYILKLNGVDRAQITDPGVEPRVFAWGTIGAFAVAWLVIFVLWLRVRRRSGSR